MEIECRMCGYEGDVKTFPPNISSVHNAIRCPKCGSTKNRYNSMHSMLMTEVLREQRKGPVTHEMVIRYLNA